MTGDETRETPARRTEQERRLRLAAALRENLLRRKARARALAGPADPAPPAKDDAPCR